MPLNGESSSDSGTQPPRQVINVYNNKYPVCTHNKKTDGIEELDWKFKYTKLPYN